MFINSIDRDALRDSAQAAFPFPYIVIDDFLDHDFALRCARSFPNYADAKNIGKSFASMNENRKVQVTDENMFSEPLQTLSCELRHSEWLRQLSYIFRVDELAADPLLVGGGIHMTAASGNLDVHVDFNYHKKLNLFRRLNILIYFNEHWSSEWGGELELWDSIVKTRHNAITPKFNRCIIFATSNISFHGVKKIKCPQGVVRKSFAAYYYSPRSASENEQGHHSTLFRARPNELLKKYVLMPGRHVTRKAKNNLRAIKKWAAK